MSNMSIREAIKLFTKQVSGRRVIGYWKKSNGFVLNTREAISSENPDPGQFMVTFDGNVYGTNPVLSDLDDADYIRI